MATHFSYSQSLYQAVNRFCTYYYRALLDIGSFEGLPLVPNQYNDNGLATIWDMRMTYAKNQQTPAQPAHQPAE